MGHKPCQRKSESHHKEVKVPSNLKLGNRTFHGPVNFIEDGKGRYCWRHEHVDPAKGFEVLPGLERSDAHVDEEEDVKGQNDGICDKIPRKIGVFCRRTMMLLEKQHELVNIFFDTIPLVLKFVSGLSNCQLKSLGAVHRCRKCSHLFVKQFLI